MLTRHKEVNIMANIKSAEKRIKVISKKTAINKARKSELKTVLKKFNAAVDSGDKAVAEVAFANAEKALRVTASKGTLHKNTSSRKVSRLARKLNNMA